MSGPVALTRRINVYLSPNCKRFVGDKFEIVLQLGASYYDDGSSPSLEDWGIREGEAIIIDFPATTTHRDMINRRFTGTLYRMPEDTSTARTERAWNKLSCQLLRTAVGFQAMGSTLYYPHEVGLQKVLKRGNPLD